MVARWFTSTVYAKFKGQYQRSKFTVTWLKLSFIGYRWTLRRDAFFVVCGDLCGRCNLEWRLSSCAAGEKILTYIARRAVPLR